MIEVKTLKPEGKRPRISKKAKCQVCNGTFNIMDGAVYFASYRDEQIKERVCSNRCRDWMIETFPDKLHLKPKSK